MQRLQVASSLAEARRAGKRTLAEAEAEGEEGKSGESGEDSEDEVAEWPILKESAKEVEAGAKLKSLKACCFCSVV